MFSSKPHINILTAALRAYGIEHIIVCAGARNGILAHNFQTAGFFQLYSAVDERSAAFMALGMTLATGTPVCVCVTSGSALLGCLPATAEAYYRWLPILILSADRPAEWIDRLDGQTIHQVGALEPYAQTWNIEELPPHEASEAKSTEATKAKLHEALAALYATAARPIHINVPISEPLFVLGEHKLPLIEKNGQINAPREAEPLPPGIIDRINAARLPVLVIGQYEATETLPLEEIEKDGKLLVLPELLANCKNSWRTAILEKMLCDVQGDEDCKISELPKPDLIIHIGLNSVHKKLRSYLRSLHCSVVRISEDDDRIDTFSASSFFAARSPLPLALQQISEQVKATEEVRAWQTRLSLAAVKLSISLGEPPAATENISMAYVLRELSVFLRSRQEAEPFVLHLANSSVVREACCFFDGGEGYPIHCNRGTNGIEGSVSAAAGYALASPGMRSILLTGDLSFLYDQNGLWDTALGGNLRIIVFNDGGGGIFHRMPALKDIPERHTLISAPHNYSAKGVAETFRLTYLRATNLEDFPSVIKKWWIMPSDRPVILEV